MKNTINVINAIYVLLYCASSVFAQSSNDVTPICSSEEAPYRDFDFVLGSWDFYTSDSVKIGKQVYTKREQGCLILEEWELDSGDTGIGMSFVDPATGNWRQVWMSPTYHIDYSGGIDEQGAMILEGTAYPNNGEKSFPIRGIWAKQSDGSIKQEFFFLDEGSNTWQILFAGFTRLSDSSSDG